MRTIHLRTITLCALALTISACTFLQPQPDKSRFFVLTPTAPAAEHPAAKPLRLGLGPVMFPAYLQRTQMVTRIGDNEITLSEMYRWGEALDSNFARVLAQNLAELLATNQIVLYPWYTTVELDYSIRIDVTQFDADTEGVGRLRARWRIVDPASDKMLRTGFADLREQATDSSPDAVMAALSKLVEQLGHDLADNLEALRP